MAIDENNLDEETADRIEQPVAAEAEVEARLTPAEAIERMRINVPVRGNRKLRTLIERENDQRLRALGRECPSLLTTTLDCVFTLAHAGLGLGSVPEPGRRVQVKATTNQSGPADCRTVATPIARSP